MSNNHESRSIPETLMALGRSRGGRIAGFALSLGAVEIAATACDGTDTPPVLSSHPHSSAPKTAIECWGAKADTVHFADSLTTIVLRNTDGLSHASDSDVTRIASAIPTRDLHPRDSSDRIKIPNIAEVASTYVDYGDRVLVYDKCSIKPLSK